MPVSEMLIVDKALERGRGALNEYEAKRLVAGFGVPVAQEFLAETADQAARAAVDLGFPVALKACSHELHHKKERGLVMLGLDSGDAVRDACGELARRAQDIELDGFLVQAMALGERELLLGVSHAPGFGPCVTLGLGGIFAEVLRDVSIRMAPVSEADAHDMIDCLRGAAVLGAVRGLAPVDRDTLVRAIRGLGACALENPAIAEIDVNPVIVRGDGSLCAVDALVILNGGGHAS